MTLSVADVMTPRPEVVVAEVPGTREDALEHLRRRAFSSLPVVKEEDGVERFRGIVSREALIENPEEDQLALLMDEEVPAVDPGTELAAACATMAGSGHRRLPVVDGEGALVGIVTVTDVVRAIADGRLDAEPSVVAGDVAADGVNTSYAETPLSVVERELSYAGVPYALVLDGDGDVAGIVTDADVIAVAEVVEGETRTGGSMAVGDEAWRWESIRSVGDRRLPTRNVSIPDEPVREFMTADLVSVGRRAGIVEIARALVENDVEQVPVTAGEDVVGVVRDVDLLAGVA